MKLIPSAQKTTTEAERIFVSRKSKTRLPPNQKEIEALFDNYGFKTLYFEDLTTSQQRLYMANAKFVAGIHGAGLINLIACRSSTVVLEF